MARKRVVSRTIKGSRVEVLCLDLANEEAKTVEVILGQIYSDSKKLLKAVEPYLDFGLKAVAIKNTEVIQQRYAMDEAEFIKLATPVM